MMAPWLMVVCELVVTPIGRPLRSVTGPSAAVPCGLRDALLDVDVSAEVHRLVPCLISIPRKAATPRSAVATGDNALCGGERRHRDEKL